MIRGFIIWAILSLAIGAGLHIWRQATGKEKWLWTKIMAYAIMCSLGAVVLLSFIVVFF